MFGKLINKGKDPIVQEYREYRRLGKELSSEILNKFTDDASLRTVAKLMGIMQGKTMIFESEAEMELVMDFSFFEYKVNNQNFIQRYLEAEPSIDEKTRILLESKLKSYTSLFKITGADAGRSRLQLVDLLNNQNQVEIIDINLSRTAAIGFLMFTRIIPMPNFNMTSGMYCVFPGDAEKAILKRHKVLAKKVNSTVESVQRFIAFFKLNRVEGLSAETRDV